MSNNQTRNRGGKESAIVKRLLQDHREAIVILLDQDKESQGESRIGVFTKLLESDSKLSQVLESILTNLQRTRDAKSSQSSRDPIKDQTSGPQKEHPGSGTAYGQGCSATFCCQNH